MSTPGTLLPIDIDDGQMLPEKELLAYSIVRQKKKQQKDVPQAANLADAITDITLNGSIKNVSNLVIEVYDPNWEFLRSGFLDTDGDSLIDPIDVNFPDGSIYWWRLTIVSPSASSHSLTLTFLVREAVFLTVPTGPLKADRARVTRAEFLKQCAEDKRLEAPIEFYSHELDIKQPIARPKNKKKKGSGAKLRGLGANGSKLTCKGQPLNSTQIYNANAALAVGVRLKAPHNALVAAIYGGMGESSLGKDGNTFTASANGGSVGVWQAQAPHYNNGHDVEGMATGFYKGGVDFQAGGAIHCAQRGDPAWQVANEVMANKIWNETRGDSYAHQFPGGAAQGLREAEAIVSGAGAGLGGTTSASTTEAYNLEIKPKEPLWDGMQRLAQEVNWELFWDGPRLYYDSEQDLIKQEVSAVVDIDDDVVADWSYDWDARQICSQMTLTLFDDPWEFQPGETFQVTGFGPASTGSSADPKRPGVWLIQDSTRKARDEATQYTLVQPDLPKLEPGPQIKNTTVSKGIGNATPRTAEAAYAAAQYLDSLHTIYSQAVRTLKRDISKLSGKPCFDCSASVSWVLLAAGFKLPGGVTWNGWAPVSGEFKPGAAGLIAGPGKNMTIYANDGHVFIRIHPDGASDMQGNTVNPGGHGFGFFPWTKSGCGKDGGPSPSGFVLSHYPGT